MKSEAKHELLTNEIPSGNSRLASTGGIELSAIASPALRRILDEVRNDKAARLAGGYDRVHNRHNRGCN